MSEQRKRQRHKPTERQEQEAQAAASDLRQVMGTPAGRRFVWRLLGNCRIYQSSFTGSSETFFFEGQRKVGLELLAQIHRHCPDLYLQAQKEAMDEDKRRREGGAT